MAGLFGKAKELESKLEAMQQEADEARVNCRKDREEMRSGIVRGVTNVHLYGQLALEEAETSYMKENLQAILAECDRMLKLLAEEE